MVDDDFSPRKAALNAAREESERLRKENDALRERITIVTGFARDMKERTERAEKNLADIQKQVDELRAEIDRRTKVLVDAGVIIDSGLCVCGHERGSHKHDPVLLPAMKGPCMVSRCDCHTYRRP